MSIFDCSSRKRPPLDIGSDSDDGVARSHTLPTKKKRKIVNELNENTASSKKRVRTGATSRLRDARADDLPPSSPDSNFGLAFLAAEARLKKGLPPKRPRNSGPIPYYINAGTSQDTHLQPVPRIQDEDTVACPICGRYFARDLVEKHTNEELNECEAETVPVSSALPISVKVKKKKKEKETNTNNMDTSQSSSILDVWNQNANDSSRSQNAQHTLHDKPVNTRERRTKDIQESPKKSLLAELAFSSPSPPAFVPSRKPRGSTTSDAAIRRETQCNAPKKTNQVIDLSSSQGSSKGNSNQAMAVSEEDTDEEEAFRGQGTYNALTPRRRAAFLKLAGVTSGHADSKRRDCGEESEDAGYFIQEPKQPRYSSIRGRGRGRAGWRGKGKRK